MTKATSGHSSQVTAAVRLENEPTPAPHGSHAAAPKPEENLPGSQAVQLVLRVESWNEPGLHAMHAVPLTRS
jgi:hypothetical protein